MSNFEIFSSRLKELRTSMKLTQKQFAEKIGTTSVTISAYENNAKKPSLDIVKDIAEKCDVSLDWLCGLSDKKNSSDEIETYTDIVEYLIKLSKTKKLDLLVNSDRYMMASVTFSDSVLVKFLSEWERIKELFEENIIDEDIYNPWIEAKLKECNVPISADNASDSVQDIKHELKNFFREFYEGASK